MQQRLIFLVLLDDDELTLVLLDLRLFLLDFALVLPLFKHEPFTALLALCQFLREPFPMNFVLALLFRNLRLALPQPLDVQVECL